jgi:hypothetical protein
VARKGAEVVVHVGQELVRREQMFDALLQADPSFESCYDLFLREWAGEADLPQYLALSDLARHLIIKLEQGDVQLFNAVFSVVEYWSVHGDPYVREAVAVGLLEDLQNENFHRSTEPGDLIRWLGPRSRIMWDRVDRFWKEETPISSD